MSNTKSNMFINIIKTFQCTQYNDCCRYTECLTYASKCVTKSGLFEPGADTRPLGPGPYPPNIPENVQ